MRAGAWEYAHSWAALDTRNTGLGQAPGSTRSVGAEAAADDDSMKAPVEYGKACGGLPSLHIRQCHRHRKRKVEHP